MCFIPLAPRHVWRGEKPTEKSTSSYLCHANENKTSNLTLTSPQSLRSPSHPWHNCKLMQFMKNFCSLNCEYTSTVIFMHSLCQNIFTIVAPRTTSTLPSQRLNSFSELFVFYFLFVSFLTCHFVHSAAN